MSIAVEVPPHVSNDILPGADWADAFELTLPRDGRTARHIATVTLGASPKWLQDLLSIRNAVVKPLGLKTTEDAHRQSSDSIGFFPILEETDSRVVVGLDDNHLDFRIVVELEHFGDATNVLLTTLIRRHNQFGKAYLALVSPFHKRIVPRILSQAA